MNVIPRSDWTSVKNPWPRIALPVTRLWLHHVVMLVKDGPNASQAVEREYWRVVRQIGVNRGFRDISYSYGVCPSGRVYSLAGDTVAAHTCRHNHYSLAIVAATNSDVEKPTRMMLDSIRQWVAWMKSTGRATQGAPLDPHRLVGVCSGPTACPGHHLMNELNNLRKPWEDDLSELSTQEQRQLKNLMAGLQKGSGRKNFNAIGEAVGGASRVVDTMREELGDGEPTGLVWTGRRIARATVQVEQGGSTPTTGHDHDGYAKVKHDHKATVTLA